MLNIIGWIVIGLITGAISLWLYPGEQNAGWIGAIIVGVLGSFVGGFLGGLFTKEKDMMKPTPAGFIMSIVGGLVLVFVARQLNLM